MINIRVIRVQRPIQKKSGGALDGYKLDWCSLFTSDSFHTHIGDSARTNTLANHTLSFRKNTPHTHNQRFHSDIRILQKRDFVPFGRCRNASNTIKLYCVCIIAHRASFACSSLTKKKNKTISIFHYNGLKSHF